MALVQGVYPTVIVILIYSQDSLLKPTFGNRVSNFGTNHMVTFERQLEVNVSDSVDAATSRWRSQKRSRRNVNIELPSLSTNSTPFVPNDVGDESKESQVIMAESIISNM